MSIRALTAAVLNGRLATAVRSTPSSAPHRREHLALQVRSARSNAPHHKALRGRFALAVSGLLLLLSAPAFAVPNKIGARWVKQPAEYKVFAHMSINGVSDFPGAALPAVRSGFARWTSSKVNCTSWSSSYLGTFTSPSGSAIVNGNDAKNYVAWLAGAQWTHDNQTLGLTTTTWYTDSKELFDADMEMNNNREWKVGGATQKIDVESITTHEAGHFLGLDHTDNTSTIMYATYPVGDIKVTLQPLDVQDVCGLYPKMAGTGTQGSFCAAAADCGSSAPVCRSAPGTPSAKICTIDCSSNPTCPANYTCQSDSSGGKACLPAVVGVNDLCKFCTSGSQCSTGLCVGDGRHNWCTNTCQSAASAAQSCGAGYTCVGLDGTGTFVCQPTGACSKAQCTSAANCPVGYACTGGMCEATGKVGDRCEVSTYCAACSDCIGTIDEAYCRACCGGGGAGGTCTSCMNPACGAGFSCAAESNGKDAVCIPSAGASTCVTCDDKTPCQDDLTCFNGRCLASCNVDQPGTCLACFSGSSGGLCACADAVAYKGQPCGASGAGGFIACVTGTVCTGTPSTCAVPCLNSSQCDTGENCSNVGGESVCVRNNVPGSKCNACNSSNACDSGLVCVNGRCYPPCDVSAPTCGACVDVPGAQDVCACDDQRSGPGDACGAVGNDVYACAPGSICIDGTCRLECVQGPGSCPPAEACRPVAGTYVCAPTDIVLDGGNLNPPQPKPDGGTTYGGTNGCGCGAGSGSGPVAFGFALLLWSVRPRRRRAR